MLAAYYTALVTSGVAKQLPIKAPTKHTEKVRGAGKRYYDVNYSSWELPSGDRTIKVDVLESSPLTPELIEERPFERTYKRV
jgi:hypothetical protein